MSGSIRKRKSSLNKRLKRINKELSSVSGSIGFLTRKVGKGSPADVRPTLTPSAPVEEPRPSSDVDPDLESPRDERFTDYLASSFQAVRPLRHERRIQRNRAIFMILFVAVVLFLLIYKFFL